jgi:hypothetical protein
LLQKGFGGSETALRQWDFMVPSDFGLITLEWSRAHYSFLSWHKTPSKGPNWMFRCYTNLNLNLASALAITLRNRKTNSQPWAVCGTLFGEPKSASAKQIWPWHKSLPRTGFTCRAVSWRYDERIVGNNYLLPSGTQTWHWKKHHV